jgi:iron complex outermembrane receptor protein
MLSIRAMPSVKTKKGRLCIKSCRVLAVLSAACIATHVLAADEVDPFSLSPEQLFDATVVSVSKTAQKLGDAPAAVYVITHDDIVRSGATSIPEILRLAPNLQVMQTSPSNYVISVHGFSGNTAAQNFSDKLLILIDGRSVYNPLFSGVYWDMQDVLPDDIERIEVISGPSATLWGANAFNGVINITTRKSSDTKGGLLTLGVGNRESSGSLQYGGKLSDDVTYRVYAKAFFDRALEMPSGANARDGWYKPQGGFRVDWSPAGDVVTLQGDLYRGAENQLGALDQLIAGGNLQARWQHELGDGSALQILTYYDETRRFTADHNGGFTIRTYDLEVQHNFALGSWNNVVWGAGERISPYTITNQVSSASSLLFVPTSRTLNLADAFAQDRLALTDRLDLTLGIKAENDPYSGLVPLPSVRASWKPSDSILLWTAVSRAIRSPTPFDRDVVEKLGSLVFLTGNPDFVSEKVMAYEVGYRGQLSSRASLSVSAFKNDYDDLKTIEFAPTGSLPLQWGNMMRGDVYGLEAWGTYQAADWWRLSAGFNIQHESLRFAPGGSGLLGVAQAGDDPHHQASLRSSMNLTNGVTFDADFRYVGVLPNPRVPAYVELNTRLGWAVSKNVEISLSGFNLLHAHHQEFTAPSSDVIERSFFLETSVRF